MCVMKNEDYIKHVDDLIKYLFLTQKYNGGFESLFIKSSNLNQNKWHSWGVTPYETASVMIAIKGIEHDIKDRIIKRATNYLISAGFNNKLWRFSSSQGYDPMPYDVDASALATYALNTNNFPVDNEKLLNSFIYKDNYKTWIVPSIRTKGLPPIQLFKAFVESQKAFRYNDLKVSKDDYEFAMNCNVLLGIGVSNENIRVFNKLINDIRNKNIVTLYYDIEYAYYAFARLCFHRNIPLESSTKKEIIDTVYNKIQIEKDNFNIIEIIMCMNTLIMFGVNQADLDWMIEKFKLGLSNKLYMHNYPIYSCNKVLDIDKDTGLPLNYFGSCSTTCALFLESLYLINNYAKNKDVSIVFNSYLT